MVLQRILTHPPSYWPTKGISITTSDLRFMQFIGREIFPGGAAPAQKGDVGCSCDAGFLVEQIQPLRPHYVRTLDAWAANLAARHTDAIAITSEEVYERYMRYLTGCAQFFRRGITEVGQFTLAKG